MAINHFSVNDYYAPTSPSALVTPDCVILGAVVLPLGPHAFPKNTKQAAQKQ